MYTLTGEPIGVVAEQPGSLSEKSMLLQVTLDTEGVNPSHYPMLYDAPPAPEQAFAYNVDKNNQLFQQPVKLASGATRSESVFTVSSELQLPAGTPIFDTKGQLVCLSDGSNQCYTVSKSLVERAIRGRGLNDDYDYDDEGLSTAAQIGIVAGVGVAAIAIPTTLFYLVTWLKAHSAGMSAGVYWPGILSLQYCSHCTVNTAMPAIVGTIVCPLTGMLSCLVGYPISTSMAAFNWINSYSNPSESVPIISHQPTHAPPQY
ncbi:MAG: hypothetical protein ACR2PX_02470 [Endozoicomonas sp.]|uniref:hypothetical protein n=1 Tax=Endozoicomonas sp. TaxID=1892382 RepID=UPI003D9BFBF0